VRKKFKSPKFLEHWGNQMFNPAKHFAPSQKRNYEHWVKGHLLVESMARRFTLPHLTEISKRFDPDFGFELADAPFEEIWTPPKDSSETNSSM